MAAEGRVIAALVVLWGLGLAVLVGGMAYDYLYASELYYDQQLERMEN